MAIKFTPNPPMSAADEIARAALLVSAARLIPESTYYGTPSCRVVCVGHDGALNGGPRQSKRYPMTLEIANKISRFCNGANGNWKGPYEITRGDNRLIEILKDISQPWVPATAEDIQWDTGMLTARQYNQTQHFFPMFNTVYQDTTSPLRSLFNVLVCAALERIFFKAWAMNASNTSLTDEKLIESTNKYLLDQVTGKFSDVKISPDVIINRVDSINGDSWHITFDVECLPSRNRMNHTIVTHRNI